MSESLLGQFFTELKDAVAKLPTSLYVGEVIDVWGAGDREAVRLVHPELAAALDKLMKADGR